MTDETNGAATRWLGPDDPRWPRGWCGMPDPPAAVQITGCAKALHGRLLAVVGTRRPTPRGLALARGLAAALAVRGWTVVSGLALGIDGAAHRGALEGGGRTVAVMGTGADLCYPASHASLLADIRARGCSVTEFEPGTPPLKHHFPQRNRLIAALVEGVVVVEAPVRSGAMVTARLALDYDREVFAVPGPVDLETSRGCHRLLRQGAHLLESPDDVTSVLGGDLAPADTQSPVPLADAGAAWILDRIDLEGVPRDELRGRWPGTESEWAAGLTALELAGLIRRLPGGRLARRLWRC